MVHRWAAANLRGDDASAVPNQTEIRESVDDLGTYFRDGLDGLVTALREAPDDVEAMVFLNDAPPPKQFWARRQAHETTIHMVDALSAKLGRVPTAAEAAIDSDVAVDGIDELLCGFFTRGKSKIFDGSEYDVDVVPTDSDRRWTVHVAERMTADARSPPATRHVRIAGPADAIYLALWNRGDEVEVDGRRRPARPLARRPTGALGLTTAIRSRRTYRPLCAGRPCPPARRLASTTIAWAWPNPLS